MTVFFFNPPGGATPLNILVFTSYIMSWSPAGGPAERGFDGQRPPTENLNDFHNDFRPGGRAPAGEAGGKKSQNAITTTKPTTY